MPEGSLPSREAWIEIVFPDSLEMTCPCRFPRGKRGLKYQYNKRRIEKRSRFPRGKRGLKFILRQKRINRHMSLPSREAWIEMEVNSFMPLASAVASLAGSVD